MELRTILRIIGKHKIVAVVALVLAIGGAALTYVSLPPANYQSGATVFVTGQGLAYQSPTADPNFASQLGNFTNLAYFYSEFAESDYVTRTIGAPVNSISSTVVQTPGGYALPYFTIVASAHNPATAETYAINATKAVEGYVAHQEQTNHTPKSSLVSFVIVNYPRYGSAAHVRTRLVLLPAVVFLTILLIMLGFLFTLENFRRPGRGVSNPGQGTDDAAALAWTEQREGGMRVEAGSPTASGGTWRRQ